MRDRRLGANVQLQDRGGQPALLAASTLLLVSGALLPASARATELFGGKGGGRPDMAQAGGTQPENLAAALAGVKDWVAGKL